MDAPELYIYPTSADLPHHFYYQMVAFSRTVWGEPVENYDIDLGLREEAQHFVIAQGRRLIAYATVVLVELELGGASYTCGGLGTVLTFPAFRRRGYGGRIVQSATEAIQQDPRADIGLLWTDPKNESFYNRYGWQAMTGLTTLAGNPPAPYEDELRMMLFCSAKGRAAQADFEQGTVWIGIETW